MEEDGRLCRAGHQGESLGCLRSRQEGRDTLRLTGTPVWKIFSQQRLLEVSAAPGVCQPLFGHF